MPTIFGKTADFLPAFLRTQPVNLGLDLKGGASLLLEVDEDEYFHGYYQQLSDRLLAEFREIKIKYADLIINHKGISCKLLTENNEKNDIERMIAKKINHDLVVKLNDDVIVIELSHNAFDKIEKSLIHQSIEIIRKRIDETGTKEIDLQRHGRNYILLQIPGSYDTNEIRRLLGKTAKLSMHLVADGVTLDNISKHRMRTSLKVFNIGGEHNHKVFLYSRAVITGDMLVDAQVAFNQNVPVVSFKLNDTGAKIFGDFSTKNRGKALAIVLDGKILSAPVIREPILGGSGVISGNFSVASANELALLLRAGALPAPIKIAEERVIGPGLGSDSIKAGKNAVIISTTLVMAFMIMFYGSFGLVANIALAVNAFMIVAILSFFGATLTLTGIAGIVLTLGMAVDANVLIFERIREELRRGKSEAYAIESGYNMAFKTIFDANLTTIIAAVILYVIGSGPIKSFALSLVIGITCSMFTAVSLTKTITDIIRYFTKKLQISS